MKSGNYIPESGDIVWLNFTPQAGHEQRGTRPAVILSPKNYNEKTNLCLAVPITSKVKNYPFEVKLPSNLTTKGVVLADQIKSLDFVKREAQYIEKLPNNVLKEIKKLAFLLID